MRIFLFLCFLLWLPVKGFPSELGCIEIDLTSNTAHLENLSFGDINLRGDFIFALKENNGSWIFSAQGKNIILNGQAVDLLDIELVKKGDFFFLNQFRSKEFMAKGWFNSKAEEFSLDAEVKSQKAEFLGESLEAKFKAWGGLKDFLVSGYLMVKDGRYKGEEFSSAKFSLLGRPPLLNITDSELILKNGSIYRVEGVMDVTNFNNLLPEAEFVSRKVSLGGWEFIDRDKNIEVKKDVGKKIKVLFNSYDKRDNFMDTGAEVRYKLKDDRFLRMRMQETDTIVGFENRKEF